jgi:hypothetical protein
LCRAAEMQCFRSSKKTLQLNEVHRSVPFPRFIAKAYIIEAELRSPIPAL